MEDDIESLLPPGVTRRQVLGALAGAAATLGGAGQASALTIPKFPIRQRAGRQFLEDSASKPFLLQGDAAWSLITQLPNGQVQRYLDDRASRGFNAVVVMLINHLFTTNAPANFAGQQPFLTPGDFTTWNPAYFGHAYWVVQQAAQRGMVVLLAPAYLGFQGGDQGWYVEMAANGADKLTKYGRFVGNRFKDLNNIIWLHGGDYNPPDKSLTRAVANGIRQFDTHSLHTAHCAQSTSALDEWRGESWLTFNTSYTYDATYIDALREFNEPEKMAFTLIESWYENEHGSTEQRLRTQAYQTLLSGAAGQVFGNNPIWHFDGPGLFDAPVTWQQALSGRGSKSMGFLISFFNSLQWWKMRPDLSGTFLTAGLSSDQDRAVAGRAADGSFGVVYLPGVRSITVDLRRLSGPRVAAQWYDPSNGTYQAITGSPFANTAPQVFNPGLSNASGYADWVLMLTSQA